MGINPELVARQNQATRQEILGALMSILDEGRERDITFREIAAAAGVSERTVYRHLPSRDAIRYALVPLVKERLVHVGPPPSADLLPDYLDRLYRVCEENGGLIRSLLNTELGRTVLVEERAHRVHAVHALVKAAAPARHARRVEGAAATVRYLASGQAWAFYRDQAGLPLEAAIEAATWALGRVLGGLGIDLDADLEPDDSTRQSRRPRSSR